MATELGQAYVQIMPSAKGISGTIKNQLDPEADSAGKSAGLKVGTGLKVAAMATVAATGLALGKIISSSLTGGAKLQQSLGGIETLFKGSANKVKKYADQAYKSSGLSANDYMENVTSFSASLLQSLGGNTSKAADKANMAMIDMSDNANKMGTNMEDIQNAYQGFAKQNYTMLDNLKLGYGGTKEEMQRLLSDATKLTGVKYDINNLSDVYSAIHAVQGQLGITGTTAKEAASTFSGSFNSMKAAASNVLDKMALGQDITPSLNALAQTTSTFLFNNFIPMVGNILKALPGAIGTFITAAAPSFIAGGQKMMNSLVQGMSGGKNIVGTIAPIVQSITTAFSSIDLSGIQNLFSAVLPAIATGFGTMMTIVGPAISSVISSFVGLWNAAQPLIAILSGALMPIFQIIGAFLGGFFKGVLMGISFAFDALKVVIQVLTPIIGFLVNVFKAIAPALTVVASWIGTVIGAFASLGSAGGGLKSILSSAWNGIKSSVSIAGGLIKSVVSAIKTVFNGLGSTGSSVGSIVSGAFNAMKSVISGAAGVISGVISGIKSSFSSLGHINLSAAGSAIINGFIGGLKGTWEAGKKFVGGIASWIKKHKGPISYDKKLLIPAGNAIMTGFNQGLVDRFKNVKNTIKSVTSNILNSSNIELPEVDDTSLMKSIKNVNGRVNGSINGDLTTDMNYMSQAIENSRIQPQTLDNGLVGNSNNNDSKIASTIRGLKNAVDSLTNKQPVAIINGSSMAPIYEQYGSVETARRNQLSERGISLG